MSCLFVGKGGGPGGWPGVSTHECFTREGHGEVPTCAKEVGRLGAEKLVIHQPLFVGFFSVRVFGPTLVTFF